EIELAGAHFAREMRGVGEEPDKVAVPGMDDGLDAVLPAEPGMGLEMRGLAVDGNQHGGLHQVVEALELLAPRVAGSVHQAIGLGDDLDAAVDQQVLDVDDLALVSGNGP